MIGNVTAATAAPASAASGLGGMDGQAFLQLLVAQLRYQNPMQPSDPASMLQQTAQFTQVETLQAVARSQAQLLGLQQASIAADLVGRQISAPTADGSVVRAVVDGVRFTASGPVLLAGDWQVPLDATTEIRMPTTTTGPQEPEVTPPSSD